MARPLRIQFPGAFYHVTCRGNAKRSIFLDDVDRYKFIELLEDSLTTYDVTLHAFILMNNHFHLLVQTAKANLAEFMRRFNICYTGWFNYRHDIYGHLYQGRYKAFLIDADSYLLEVSRYIHLNIIRSRHTQLALHNEHWNILLGYRWSSLRGYLNKSRSECFMNYDFILSVVGNRRGYRRFILDGLKHGVRNPFEETKYGTILGNKDFIARVKTNCTPDGSMREQPCLRDLVTEKVTPEIIIDCVADTLGIKRQQVTAKPGNSIARCITAELLYRYSGLKQNKIGKILGNVDYSAVSHMRHRLKVKMVENRKLTKQFKKAQMQLETNLSRFKI